MRGPRPPLDDYRLPEPDRRFLATSADGVRLNVQVFGEQDDADLPTVVLSHGWTCSASVWARVVHRLRSRARVVVYDQRGHGQSQPVPADGFTPTALADDLATVLETAVPTGRRAVVVGHSMGAMALVALAGRHPRILHERVQAALLANTGVNELVGHFGTLRADTRRPRTRPAARPRTDPAAGPRAVPSQVPAAAATAWTLRVQRARRSRDRVLRRLMADPRALHALPLPLARGVLTQIAMSRGASRAERAFSAGIILACPPATFAGFARMLGRLDLVAELRSLDVPTLVVSGTRDRLTPPWHARGMVAALPNPVGLIELAGQGHMTPISAPAAITEAIRRLLPPDQRAR